jgi:dihydroxyacetone kinase-like protein
VAGVTGIVFGSLFDAAGRSAAGLPGLDAGALHRMFAAGMAAAKKRGKTAEGDKSMIDALSPAVEALRSAAEKGDAAEAALALAALAAKAGMEATIPMEAKVGRARYQSGKGRGHVDAGAASICLFFQTLAAVREPTGPSGAP